MGKFIEWFRSVFENSVDSMPEVLPPPPAKDLSFDVMHIPLPGEYSSSEILDAEVKMARFGHTYAHLKLRLAPDDPNDEQRIFAVLGKYPYVELLRGLKIPRTNDVTVLVGQRVAVRVTEQKLFAGTMSDDPSAPDEITYYRGEIIGPAETPLKSTATKKPRSKRT
jgi:hypothetical protein